MKTIHSVLTGLVVVAVLVGFATRAEAQREGRRPEVRGVIKSLDTTNASIAITAGGGREPAAEKTFALAANVEVAVGGSSRLGLVQPAKLADLSPGLTVGLALSPDEKSVISILVDEPTARGFIEKVDATARTLELRIAGGGREANPEVLACKVAPEAEIGIDDGRGRRFPVREAQLTEIVPGTYATLWLSLDRKTVVGMLAEGPSLFGTIRGWNPAAKTLTMTVRTGRGGENVEDKTFTVGDDAQVLLDDGRGRRLSIKPGKPADLAPGLVATVRLSLDQSKAMQVRAEGPQVYGLLKAVDAGKKTITLATFVNRGEQPVEKTYTVSAEARITMDDKETDLASLKPGEQGPYVQARLSLDQTTAQHVIARQPGAR